MMDKRAVNELHRRATWLRQSIIRIIAAAGSGHPAGALGLADIMTVLYFHSLRISPERPDWDERDMLVMSNGHCAPVLYSVLAERGFFLKSELMSFRQFGSRLQGHPERVKLPGIETTSGPLGCGLSQAAGMAYTLKLLRRQPERFVFCILGDGELDEGNIWEAAMFANKYRLGQLVAIVDRNQIQIDGSTEKIMPLENLSEKWRSFGWQVQEVDGHTIMEIAGAIEKSKRNIDQPSVIIAQTIPGKGVDFMENDYRWHGKVPSQGEARLALAQLEAEG